MEYTLNEAMELKQLTDAIVRNLRVIANDETDLDELLKKTDRIVANLRKIDANT